jgi:hypothetical protein
MRLRWGIVLIASIVGALALPSGASADGGAYIEFNGTYFLPGDGLEGVAYVSVPRDKERLFDQGPFYAYLLPSGASLREGRPLPAGAIRAGTFTIHAGKQQSFELTVAFTVPQIESGEYWVELCNDPCSIAGFREPLTGQITVVATAREAQLLVQQNHLRSRLYGLKRQLHKSDSALKELQAGSAALAEDAATERTQVDELTAALDRTRSTIAALRTNGRPIVAPWGAALIVLALLGLAAAIAFRRRPGPGTTPAAARGLTDHDPADDHVGSVGRTGEHREDRRLVGGVGGVDLQDDPHGLTVGDAAKRVAAARDVQRDVGAVGE